MKDSNDIWNFFASVKLALFTLCTISVTSIIGTLVPQNRSSDYYVENFGPGIARFFQVLDIPDMYTSWWFLSLLGLLSANLIVCSIDRFPTAWKQITADQTAVTVNKLEKMPFTHSIHDLQPQSLTIVDSILTKHGYKTSNKTDGNTQLVAAQKGGWTRTGVYIVHLSILIIFTGAIVGYFLGFKGSVLIPETKQTDKVYASETHTPINLGFTVRCDFFEIEFYDNGMPKEYRSRLTVIENDQEVLIKDIEVNDPLRYRGITFYQSSYEGYRDFVITFTSPSDDSHRTFVAPFQQQIKWDDTEMVIGIVNAEALRDRVSRVKLWIKSGDAPAITFWLDAQAEESLEKHGIPYSVSVKQMYATGLQVAKDPGVWLVYLGCFLMMLGLYVAFFQSHRRIWVVVTTTGSEATLFLAGTTNKNKLGFEKAFSDIVQKITESVA